MAAAIPKKTLVIGAALGGVVIIYALGAEPGSSDAQGSDGTGCRVRVDADILNVRAAPNLSAQIVGKFQQDAETDAETEVRNGFRKLDDERWAANRYLQPVEGANCGTGS